MSPRSVPLPVALVLGVGSGLLLDAAFPDRGIWPLAFVALGLLYTAVAVTRPSRAFLVGSLAGVAFFLPHLAWADYSVGMLPWVALSVAQALLMGLGCAAYGWAVRVPAVGRSAVVRPLVFAATWTAAEVLRSGWPFGGFPWGRVAFSQADSPLGRFAWLGGAPLVSFLVVLVGALLATAVARLLRGRLGAMGGYVIAAFVVVAGGLFVPLSGQAQAGVAKVGAVQGNVAEPGMGAFANRFEVLGNHVAGTTALLDRVAPGELDLVVWPENASDVDPRKDQRAATAIDGAAVAVDAPILVGTQQYVKDGRYNQGVLWVPGQGIVQTYAKRKPAAFAEYIPNRELFRRFSKQVDLVRTDMLAGTTPGVFQVSSTRLGRDVGVGDIICFEVAYDAVVRSAVSAGAEVLVVQTNNANFGYTAESTQQLAMTRLRAIETGRAAVQVSTVGVSAVVDPHGRVQQRTDLFTAEQMVATMALRTSITPAVRAGDLPSMLVCALAGVAAAAGIVAAAAARARRK